MQLQRERFVSDQNYIQYQGAWESFGKAIEAEEKGDEDTAKRFLAQSCWRELSSLGFVSSMAGQYNDIKRWYRLPIKQLN